MLRIKCPMCLDVMSVVNVPPSGGQVACQKCGQQLIIPAQVDTAKPAALTPIILNKLPGSVQPLPQPARVESSQSVSKRPSLGTRDVDEQKRRRPRKKKGRNLVPFFIAGGILLSTIVIVGVILMVSLKGVDKENLQARTHEPRQANNVGPSSSKRPTPEKTPLASSQPSLPPADNNRDNSEPDSNNTSPLNGTAKKEGSSTAGESTEDNNSLQPPSFAGPSDGSGADVFPYVLKSSTFIIVLMKDGRHVGAGSGSLIDRKNRLVLTNHHVAGDALRIAVFFPQYDKNGKLIAEKNRFVEQFSKEVNIMEAKVIATDPIRDLCILQLPRVPNGVEALPLAKQSCRVGQHVHSVGNPASSGALWVYAPGVVRQLYHNSWMTRNEDSTTNNHEADVIETQSPTNHGDSGGPLVNDRGELVGVTHGGKSDGLSSISLFIDVADVRRFVESSVQSRLKTQFVSDPRALINMAGAAPGTSGGMNGSLPDLVKALDATDSSKRAKAVEALGGMGDKAKDAIPSLLKLLNDSDEFVRRSTVTALSKIGTPAKTDLPLLIGALADSNVEMRRYAATTIEKMGSDARSAASPLVASLSDQDAIVRHAAARTLGLFGQDVKGTAKAPLEAMLKDSDKENRMAAAEGLSGILEATGDIEGLNRLLKHQDAELRVFAVKALVKQGKNVKLMLGELLELAKNDNGFIRRAVIQVLGQLDPNDAKPGINLTVDALKNGDKETKLAALIALGAMVKEVQPAMVIAVKDCLKTDELKMTAIETLKKFAPNSKASLGALVEMVKDPDESTSDTAIKVIVELGSSANAAIPELIKLMDIPGNIVTQADQARVSKYAGVLAKMGKTAVPALRRGLNTTSITRWGCVKALGEMGPPAREAVRELQLLLNQEPNDFIRKDIQQAIQKILSQ